MTNNAVFEGRETKCFRWHAPTLYRGQDGAGQRVSGAQRGSSGTVWKFPRVWVSTAEFLRLLRRVVERMEMACPRSSADATVHSRGVQEGCIVVRDEKIASGPWRPLPGRVLLAAAHEQHRSAPARAIQVGHAEAKDGTAGGTAPVLASQRKWDGSVFRAALVL